MKSVIEFSDCVTFDSPAFRKVLIKKSLCTECSTMHLLFPLSLSTKCVSLFLSTFLSFHQIYQLRSNKKLINILCLYTMFIVK